PVNFLAGFARSHKADNGPNRNAQTTNTRFAAHDGRVDGDAIESQDRDSKVVSNSFRNFSRTRPRQPGPFDIRPCLPINPDWSFRQTDSSRACRNRSHASLLTPVYKPTSSRYAGWPRHLSAPFQTYAEMFLLSYPH